MLRNISNYNNKNIIEKLNQFNKLIYKIYKLTYKTNLP